MLHAADGRRGIHGPSGLPPGRAGGFCQTQAVVSAAPAAVCALLGDVARWPQWVPGVTWVRAVPPARTYEVGFHGHRFEVCVGEPVAPDRFGWSAAGAGVRLSQEWLLTEVEDGTHVVTAYVVRAPAAPPGTSSAVWVRRLNALWLAQIEECSRHAARDRAARPDPVD